MANVGGVGQGVSQLMETGNLPATQTSSTGSAPAPSFATVMRQANDDAGVPAATVPQSAPKGIPQKTDGQPGDKHENAEPTTSDAAPAAATPETPAVAVKVQTAAAPRVNPSHYTSANLLAALLNPGGNATALAAAKSGQRAIAAANLSPDPRPTAYVDGSTTAPLAAQTGPAPAGMAVQQPTSASKLPNTPVSTAVSTADITTAAKLSSVTTTAATDDDKASPKTTATIKHATEKPEATPSVASSSSQVVLPLPLAPAPATAPVQAATDTVPSSSAVDQATAVAGKLSAQPTNAPAAPVASTFSATTPGGAATLLPQTQQPNAPTVESTPITGLAPAPVQPARTSSITQPIATPAAATMIAPTADALKFTPAVTALPNADSPTQNSALPTGPSLQTAPVSAAPVPSPALAQVGTPSTSSVVASRPSAAVPTESPAIVAATPRVSSTNSASANSAVARQAMIQPVPPVPTASPTAAPNKANAKPSLSLTAVAASAAPPAANAVQPAAAGDMKDSKDTLHAAPSPAAIVAQQSAPVSPAPMVDSVNAIATPIAVAHTPVALTSLSNATGPALTATSVPAMSGTGGETLPHTTLSSTPTTLEVGVANGTHGWLKIRAELNASGTVDASLTGANAAATGKLNNDLPALSSFLQDERVALGSLNVGAPSGTVSALHATVAATLEPASAFSRSAAEAVGATGTAVASDAGTSGGRAPHQEPNQAPLQSGNAPLGNLREDDGLLGAVTAPAVYGDINDLGNNGALASGSYNGGGSWLNVRV